MTESTINYRLDTHKHHVGSDGKVVVDNEEFMRIVSDATRWAYFRRNYNWIRHRDDDAWTDEGSGFSRDESYAAAQLKLKYDTDLSCKPMLDNAIDKMMTEKQFEFSWK